jgi:DNA invertase Pin-like site-specific DNA recombinase
MVEESTQAGFRTARTEGRYGGWRPKFTQAQRAEILSMLTAGRPAAEVARLFQVHRATISRLSVASGNCGLRWVVQVTFENLAKNDPAR